jgi:hypothetical protein
MKTILLITTFLLSLYPAFSQDINPGGGSGGGGTGTVSTQGSASAACLTTFYNTGTLIQCPSSTTTLDAFGNIVTPGNGTFGFGSGVPGAIVLNDGSGNPYIVSAANGASGGIALDLPQALTTSTNARGGILTAGSGFVYSATYSSGVTWATPPATCTWTVTSPSSGTPAAINAVLSMTYTVTPTAGTPFAITTAGTGFNAPVATAAYTSGVGCSGTATIAMVVGAQLTITPYAPPVTLTANQVWQSTGTTGQTTVSTQTPQLGTGTSAGDVVIGSGAGGSAAVGLTTWGSAATANNTILGFATAPVTGHVVTCVTSGVVCTLTDGGAPSGTGTVTSVIAGTGLSGGTITTTGTIAVTGGAGQILAGATPALTATPALGTDASAAGTLQLSNGAGGGAHTIFGSAATTTNTINGPTVVPANGDLLTCATSGSTCTLTDGGGVPSYYAIAGMNVRPVKTASYPITGPDFINLVTIPFNAAGAVNCTVVINTSQPSAGKFVDIVSYGVGVVTIVANGQNLNGAGTSIPMAASTNLAPTHFRIVSNGTDYVVYP